MNIEDLEIFKKSHQLTLDLYALTKQFPVEEKFGLTAQVKRSSASICANLMEGGYRNNTREYRQFAGISRGSVGELKYHLLLLRDLQYISTRDYEKYISTLDTIGKMLYGLIKSLEIQIH